MLRRDGRPRDVRLVLVGDRARSSRAPVACRRNGAGLHARLVGRLGLAVGLAAHYASADVFVHPRDPHEPFGIGPLEAMAAGTPVVVSVPRRGRSYADDGNTLAGASRRRGHTHAPSATPPPAATRRASTPRAARPRRMTGRRSPSLLARRSTSRIDAVCARWTCPPGPPVRAALNASTPEVPMETSRPARIDAPPGRRASLRAVLLDLVRHPRRELVSAWNYKTAVASAVLRGSLFFAMTISAGLDATLGAFGAEFVWRFVIAGFYGALAQAFGRVDPPRGGAAGRVGGPAGQRPPARVRGARSRGRRSLGWSLAASVALTMVSTAFAVFATRQGVLLVGVPGRRPFLDDLVRMPALMRAFAAAAWRRRPQHRESPAGPPREYRAS